MNRDEAGRLMTALGSGWPHTPINADTAEVWWHSVLQRLPWETGLAVVMRIIETEERFPTIARFNETRRMLERRAAENEPKQLNAEPPATMSAGQRWQKIADVIRLETPDFRPGAESVHHHGIEPGMCAFCQERFALDDDELERRLAAVGA